jgi:hypothetical protein
MALGSLVDSPLQQNPLAGGGLGGALEAPAPTYDELQGDALVKQIQGRMMQQDVKSPAFNAFASEVIKTKGYPTKTIQEYNTLFPNNLLTQNPLLNAGSNANFNVSPPGTLKLDPQADMPDTLGPQLIDPGAEARRKADEEFLKTADEYQRGFRESEFYKPNAPMTTDVAEFLYKSPTGEDITMKGSSSKIGQFGSYLDSIGKGDLLQSVGSEIALAQTPGLQDLAKVEPESPNLYTPPTPTIPNFQAIPKLDGTKTQPVTVSGDDSIASTATVNPYQEQFTGFGNQLTGFGDQLTGFGDQFGGLDKQFDTINTRLNSMDEGIAGLSELLQPQQKLYNSPYSNFNFRNNSYSNPSPFGLGSLFGRRY